MRREETAEGRVILLDYASQREEAAAADEGEGVARSHHRGTLTSSSRSGIIVGHLRYTPGVLILGPAGCSDGKGYRLVTAGTEDNPGPHAPRWKRINGENTLVDCVGDPVEGPR